MIIALKCIFLFLAIVYGFSNIAKIITSFWSKKIDLSHYQLSFMAIGIIGFLILHVFLKL